MKYQLVELNLPKFDVKSKYSLKKELVALGLDHLFDDRLADFSRMTASGNNDKVFVQNSCHFLFSGPIVVMVWLAWKYTHRTNDFFSVWYLNQSCFCPFCVYCIAVWIYYWTADMCGPVSLLDWRESCTNWLVCSQSRRRSCFRHQSIPPPCSKFRLNYLIIHTIWLGCHNFVPVLIIFHYTR